MEEVSKFILELYQFGFISSILYILYSFILFWIMWYGRVKRGKDTKLMLSLTEKVSLLISVGIILSFLI